MPDRPGRPEFDQDRCDADAAGPEPGRALTANRITRGVRSPPGQEPTSALPLKISAADEPDKRPSTPARSPARSTAGRR